MNVAGERPRSRLLVVDDAPANIELLLGALEKDYDVSFATSGARALSLLEQAETPDLILLDVLMPEMDGYQLCRRIKADRLLHDIPVIFVSAQGESEAESSGLMLGAEDYLTKPINVDIARLRIRNVLERARLRRELELTLACADQGLWQWDIARGLVVFDPQHAGPLGYAPGEMRQNVLPWAQVIYPEDLPHLHAAGEENFAGRQPLIDVELRLRSHDDAWTWVHLLGKAVPGKAGTRPARAVGTYMNIAARKHGESLLEQNRQRLATLIGALPDSVLTFDTALCLTDVHIAVAQACLFPGSDWQGRMLGDCLPPVLAATISAAMLDAFDRDAPQSAACALTCGGEQRHFSVTVSRILGAAGWPTGFLAVIRDVTDLKRAEEELRQLAFHDALTHLPNRRLLLDRLGQARLASERQQSWGAVLFHDLNRFKQLNDTHGHDVGDLLLIEVARRLRATVREVDTVARLGGDEFVVLLEELGGEEAEAARYARHVAEKILAALREEFSLGEIRHSCGASIGIRLFRGVGEDVDQILKDADAAMYRDKQQRAAAVTK